MTTHEVTISAIDTIRLEDGLMSSRELFLRLDTIRSAWRRLLEENPEPSWDTVRNTVVTTLASESYGATSELLERFMGELQSTQQDEFNRDLEDHDDLNDLVNEYAAFAFARFEAEKANAAGVQEADPEWFWQEAEGIWYRLVDGDWDPQVGQTANGTVALNRAKTEWVLTYGSAGDIDVEKAANDLAAMADFVIQGLDPEVIDSLAGSDPREFVIDEIVEYYSTQ